jgi:hypothetical protein
MDKPKPLKTWVQPRQSVLAFHRKGTIVWFELECGHEEPRTGLARPDLLATIACPWCNPIPRTGPVPQAGWE